jgi:branched-chain amino acid aminotransferase
MPTIGPRGPIALDPAASVLHYAQEIFEGLKAYRHPDGGSACSGPRPTPRASTPRPDGWPCRNCPPELFIEAIRALLRSTATGIPTVEGGSLYLRPFMIATEAFLGVRPAKEYKFIVIASPAGNYFKSGARR